MKMNELKSKDFWKDQLIITIGVFLYVVPYNLITTPMHLYSGYLTGIAQIARTLLSDYAHIKMTFDWTGIILYLINIPLFVLAFKTLGRTFFYKTIINVTVMTIFFSIIPVSAEPLVSDPMAGCLVAGVVSGFGGGIILRYGGSCGGMDIVGMYATKKNPNFSVGKITMMMAAVIFTICAFLYNIETVIFSAIFTIICSLALDKTYFQNIKMSATIFTNNIDVGPIITHDLGRGANTWRGEGTYTHQDTYVFMTIISKYEMGQLKRKVREIDPKAFIVFQQVTEVSGNYESRL